MSLQGELEDNTLQRTTSVSSLNPDGGPQCNTHRKRMKFFCCKHELLLCSICAVKRHRLCDEVLTIEEAMAEKKNEGKRIVDTYSRRVSIIEHAVTDRRASRKLLDSSVQEVQSEIHELTQKLIDLLKSEQRTLLQTLKNIQANETESIEKDIGRLESIKAKVKSSSNTLSNDLSNENVDLINSVVKEKKLSSERFEDDGIVKKPFRDVDIKFTVSPHILSFLKNFKVLGQITLMEETNNNKSQMHTQANLSNDSSVSSVSRQRNYETVSDNSQTYDASLTTRGRWERNRQSSYYGNFRQRGKEYDQTSSDRTDSSQYGDKQRRGSVERVQDTDIMNERPSSAMSLNVPKGTATHFTAYPARPSSIPVDVMIDKTREHRQASQSYKFARAIPYNESVADTNAKRSNIEQTGRDVSFSRRLPRPVISERKQFLDNTRTRSVSPTSPKYLKYPIVEIKDEDGRFGRSFAAVQINELNTSFENDIGQSDIGVKDETFEFEPYQGPQNSPPFDRIERRPGIRIESKDRNSELNRSLSPGRDSTRVSSPTQQHDSSTYEMKARHWTHKVGFASNGHGSKRLISGIACLSDGRVVLVDQEHYTVQMYDNVYRFLHEIKLDSRPFDVIALSDNKIAVSLQSERVIKFFLVMDGSLTQVADLGVPCDLVCYGFCRGGGNYFICGGDEIVTLSDQGRLVGRIKVDETGKELFSRAEYISTDRNGSTVYVSDVGASKVIALHLSGRKLWELCFPGFQPAGIKVVENYVYISDKGQHRILLLNIDGQVLKQNLIGRIENPCALCLNMSKNLMFVTQMRYDAIIHSPRPIQVFQLQ